MAENAVPGNSPQEVAVAHLLGPALVPRSYLKSECKLEGSARCGLGGGREGPASCFPPEAHTPPERRRVCVGRAGSPVQGECAGQTAGGEVLYGTRHVRLLLVS